MERQVRCLVQPVSWTAELQVGEVSMAILSVQHGGNKFPERLCEATFAFAFRMTGLLLLVCFGGGVGTSFGTELVDQQLRERLLSEAVPTWQRMREAWLEDLACDSKERDFVVYRDDSGQWHELDYTFSITFCFAGPYRLVRRGGGREIRLTNPDYTALIGQRSSDGPYILKAASLASSSQPIELQREEVSAFAGITAGTWAAGKPLEVVLKSNDFQLLRLEEVQPGGTKVRLEFRYSIAQLNKSVTQWVELDPNNFWLIHRSGWHGSDGNIATGEYEYGPPYRGFPFPKRFRFVVRNTAPGREKEHEETTCTFGVPRPANCVKEEFYLEHYGIPRAALEKMAPRRFPALLMHWIGIAGIVVATGIFLYAWRRRRQRNR